ncbi:MAG: AAA family ATPase [Sediminibacterium sp.]
MEFRFSNLGIVKKATIELNGITIITGLNDTGKSFISKGIYSIIKSINESDANIGLKRAALIAGLFNQINFSHRQLVPFTQEKLAKFNSNLIQAKINELLVNKTGSRAEIIDLISEYVDRVTTDMKSHSISEKTIEIRIRAIQQIKDQISLNISELSNAEIFETYFNEEIIQKMFQGQINNVNDENSSTTIKLSDGATELLNFSVDKNKTKINSDYAPISTIFRDATIIETPIIANLERYITYTLAYVTQGQLAVQLPNHYVDLAKKINASSSNPANLFEEVLTNIRRIIGGEVKFLPDQGGVVFIKANGSVIKVNNMATGIKSFGLLQILLTSGVINPASLLIIDEPEVHLHPKWEIEYAKLLVLLSKAGVQIIISSHSPYFIQAISKTADSEKVPTIFYFGTTSEDEKSSNFTNVTSDITPILAALAQPFKEMYNINA